jgi:UDP-GlcNAc:undecaprenyl-phosphate GlcNAc-1-phosphate transferase
MAILSTALLLAFSLSVVAHVLLKSRARRFGLVDVPLGRKLHDGIVPVIGGVAMFMALVPSLAFAGLSASEATALLAALALLVACGVADDLLHLPATAKLAVQFAASALMLGPLLPGGTLVPGGPWAAMLVWPLALVFTVGAINVVNMLDGVDGLAGGSAAIAFAWLAAAGPADAAALPLLLAAVTAGFLVFNLRHPWRRRAAVFMGDAGSLMLGAALAWCSVRFVRLEPGAPWAVVLWILGLPIIDGVGVTGRRLLRGANPMRADSTHLHHRLRAAGLSVTSSVALLLFAGLVLGALGVTGWRLGLTEGELLAGLALPVLLHALVVTGLARRERQHRGGTAQAIPAAIGSAAR